MSLLLHICRDYKHRQSIWINLLLWISGHNLWGELIQRLLNHMQIVYSLNYNYNIAPICFVLFRFILCDNNRWCQITTLPQSHCTATHRFQPFCHTALAGKHTWASIYSIVKIARTAMRPTNWQRYDTRIIIRLCQIKIPPKNCRMACQSVWL